MLMVELAPRFCSTAGQASLSSILFCPHILAASHAVSRMALVVTENQKLDAALGLLKDDVVGEPLQLSTPIAFSDKMETGRVRDNQFDCPLDLAEDGRPR